MAGTNKACVAFMLGDSLPALGGAHWWFAVKESQALLFL